VQGQQSLKEEEEKENDEGDAPSGISSRTEPRTLSAVEHHEARSTRGKGVVDNLMKGCTKHTGWLYRSYRKRHPSHRSSSQTDDEDVSRMKNAQTAFEIMTQLPIEVQAGTATTLTEQGVRTAVMKAATSRKLIEQRKALY
jgi:hypothetical protein